MVSGVFPLLQLQSFSCKAMKKSFDCAKGNNASQCFSAMNRLPPLVVPPKPNDSALSPTIRRLVEICPDPSLSCMAAGFIAVENGLQLDQGLKHIIQEYNECTVFLELIAAGQ